MKKLISKRNDVYLKDGKVYKQFNVEGAARIEADFLYMLRQKGVSVPAVLRLDGNILVTEYIPGVTLPDLLCDLHSTTDWLLVAEAITHWLNSFYHAVSHETTGEIRGDVNGRNFIFHDGNVWGVDFEAHQYGIRETDAGRLLAFIATYDTPNDTEKHALAKALEQQFSDVLKLKPDTISIAREKELQAISIRRNR